jgi:hypothetical protein
VDVLILSALRTGESSTVTRTDNGAGSTFVTVDQNGDGIADFSVQVFGTVDDTDFVF